MFAGLKTSTKHNPIAATVPMVSKMSLSPAVRRLLNRLMFQQLACSHHCVQVVTIAIVRRWR